MQVCQDFLNGRCHRANCRYHHQARPDGTMPEQVPPPTAPKFVAPPDLDKTLYDPSTGFGLYGKPTYGTRFGSGPLPIIRAEDTRPVCIEFYNTGRCTRRGPHGQSCMYRHVAKDDPNKVDQNKPTGAAAKVDVRPTLPPGWVSESSKRHPLFERASAEKLKTALQEFIDDKTAARKAREEEQRRLHAAATAAAEAQAFAAPATAEMADGTACAASAAAAPAVADEAATEAYRRQYAEWYNRYQAWKQQEQMGMRMQPPHATGATAGGDVVGTYGHQQPQIPQGHEQAPHAPHAHPMSAAQAAALPPTAPVPDPTAAAGTAAGLPAPGQPGSGP